MEGDVPLTKLVDLKVSELKENLRRRGLVGTGKKAQLIERLAKAIEEEGLDPQYLPPRVAGDEENQQMDELNMSFENENEQELDLNASLDESLLNNGVNENEMQQDPLAMESNGPVGEKSLYEETPKAPPVHDQVSLNDLTTILYQNESKSGEEAITSTTVSTPEKLPQITVTTPGAEKMEYLEHDPDELQMTIGPGDDDDYGFTSDLLQGKGLEGDIKEEEEEEGKFIGGVNKGEGSVSSQEKDGWSQGSQSSQGSQESHIIITQQTPPSTRIPPESDNEDFGDRREHFLELDIHSTGRFSGDEDEGEIRTTTEDEGSPMKRSMPPEKEVKEEEVEKKDKTESTSTEKARSDNKSSSSGNKSGDAGKKKVSDSGAKKEEFLVKITGVSGSCTASQVKRIIEKYVKGAKISGVKIVTNKKAPEGRLFALVTFPVYDDAHRCLVSFEEHRIDLNHNRLHAYKGNTWVVPKRSSTEKRSSESRTRKEDKSSSSKDKGKDRDVVKSEPRRSNNSDRNPKPSDDKRKGSSSLDRRPRYDGDRKPSDSRERGRDRGRKSPRPTLTFDQIRAARERERVREREMREREREKRHLQTDILRQKAIENRNRVEFEILEKERLRLRKERERLDREREKLLELENERLRAERRDARTREEESKREKLSLRERERERERVRERGRDRTHERNDHEDSLRRHRESESRSRRDLLPLSSGPALGQAMEFQRQMYGIPLSNPPPYRYFSGSHGGAVVDPRDSRIERERFSPTSVRFDGRFPDQGGSERGRGDLRGGDMHPYPPMVQPLRMDPHMSSSSSFGLFPRTDPGADPFRSGVSKGFPNPGRRY